MEISIRLHGTVVLPDPTMPRELALEMDDEVTVGGVMATLERDHPALFSSATASCAEGGPPGKICLFAGPVHLQNPKARLRDKLKSGQQLSVALLRPIPGG